MLKLTAFDDTNEITIMKMANYNNHVKNNKMKNNYSKKLKFRTTINLMIIYYLLTIIISPNEVIGQSQQFTSNPTMTIPQMEWINMDSKYPSTNTVVPPGLKNFAFGYHSDSKNVIIYGGSSSGGGVSGQTYMLDLNTMLWKNPTTDPTKTGPDPRTRMLFGIDKWSSYRDQLVIFGGKGNGDIVYNDIWSFNVPYFTWAQISNISPSASFIPKMYDTLGGIDSTLAVFNNPNNTMWITHGTDGTNFFNETWAIGLGGSWAPGNNGLTANIVKVDMSSSSVIPSGRREAGGAILPNNRIVTYGGCNNTSPAECAIPETFSLQLNSDGVNPPAYNAKPFWAEQNRCLGSREEAAMVMVGKKPQDNLAVVFGGKAANGTGIGGDGEVGVLDANLGTWVRVLPKPDPVYNVPKARAGARMLSAQTALLGSATDVVDILMYGGEALDGSSKYYNDLWILRLYTGIPISQSTSNSTAPVKFLDCIVEDVSPTSVSPPSPSSSGTSHLPTGKNPGPNSTEPVEQDFADAIVPISHLLFSTIGYLLLVVSFSIVRFGYNSNFKLLVGISYALLLVSSCAIAFYGFSVAFIDVRDDLASHFSSFHGLVGVILIILLYILVPLLALILLFMTKSFDPPNNNNNDEKLIKTIDHDNAYNANKGGFLNKLSAISNRNPFKKGSNDDYSDSNGKSKTFEVTRQSLSIMKSVSDDNDWMEQRRSVSLADNHKAVNSFGSRNNSLQNNSSQNSDASSPGSRLGTGLGLSSSSNNNFKTNIDNSDDSNHRKNNSSSSNVSHGNRSNIDDKPNNSIMIVRHIFHIITQIILLLGAIYIAYYLGATKMLNRVFCIIFIALVAFVYLVWLFAAWLGYPKDRGSLLVSFAAKYCGGRDNYLPYSNEGDESDDEGKREVTAVSPSPLNIKNVNSGKNDVDEDAEQDMRDREVVVMTIPKRRLAVVNV